MSNLPLSMSLLVFLCLHFLSVWCDEINHSSKGGWREGRGPCTQEQGRKRDTIPGVIMHGPAIGFVGVCQMSEVLSKVHIHLTN